MRVRPPATLWCPDDEIRCCLCKLMLKPNYEMSYKGKLTVSISCWCDFNCVDLKKICFWNIDSLILFYWEYLVTCSINFILFCFIGLAKEPIWVFVWCYRKSEWTFWPTQFRKFKSRKGKFLLSLSLCHPFISWGLEDHWKYWERFLCSRAVVYSTSLIEWAWD